MERPVTTGARKWTDEEDQRLLTLRATRKPIAVIAKEFERTETAVRDRLLVLKKRGARIPVEENPQQSPPGRRTS